MEPAIELKPILSALIAKAGMTPTEAVELLTPITIRIAKSDAKNAELEAHVQELANDIGHRHDAADASRQRIEELEEQRAEAVEALRRAVLNAELRDEQAFTLMADVQGVIINLQPAP